MKRFSCLLFFFNVFNSKCEVFLEAFSRKFFLIHNRIKRSILCLHSLILNFGVRIWANKSFINSRFWLSVVLFGRVWHLSITLQLN